MGGKKLDADIDEKIKRLILVEGKTDPEIASELHVSVSTVIRRIASIRNTEPDLLPNKSERVSNAMSRFWAPESSEFRDAAVGGMKRRAAKGDEAYHTNRRRSGGIGGRISRKGKRKPPEM